MHEGVTICNLKIDSKSEFRDPDTVEERERCAREASEAKWPSWPPRVEAVGHTARPALWSRVAHVPHTARS